MILDFKDTQMCDNLNHVISGLLPHSKYEPKNFGLLYPMLTNVLKISDVRGVHYTLFFAFEKYFSLQASTVGEGFAVRITRDRFGKILENNLPDLVLEPKMEVTAMMNEEGKSGDINIPTVQNEAMNVIYEKAMALYETCFALEQGYDDALAYIIDLQDSIRANVIETGMQMQRAIMSTGLRYGKKLYRGTSGWTEFTQQLVREVDDLDSNTKDDLQCVSLDILPEIEGQTVQMSEGLANYGIPLLDDYTPMLRNRFVVLVARENTGKTKVVTHLIATLIRANRKVYFACGEAQPSAMFLRIVSSYLFQEYGLYFETSDLIGEGFQALSPEDKQAVHSAKARVSTSGIIISNSLTYDNVTATFTEAYQKGCEAFFIDHSLSLRGRKGRTLNEVVTNLALDCREFKSNNPVYICVTSQPSTDLKDILQKEQTKDIQKSPTAHSSAPSQEADELFILNDTEYFSKQNILQWIVFKRRDAVRPPAFFIRKLFHVSAFQYDPNVQSGDTLDAIELNNLISSEGLYDDEQDADSEGLQVDY